MSNKKSGPKSQEALVKVSKNAITHGITAARIIIPGESIDDFNLHRNDLFDHYKPSNAVDCQLVDCLAVALWRWRRYLEFEAILITRTVETKQEPWLATIFSNEAGATKSREGIVSDACTSSTPSLLESLARYGSSIERSILRLLNQLPRIGSEQKKSGRDGIASAQLGLWEK